MTLLDCMDRLHPALFDHIPGYRTRHRFYGTGHYIKEPLVKPAPVRHVPRNYSRYGLPKSLVRRLLETSEKPALVMMTSGMTYWYPGVFEMIALCHEIFPGIPVMLGGVYATLCHEHARSMSGADHVLAGSAVPEMLELVSRLTRFPLSGDIDTQTRPAYDLYTRIQTAAVRTAMGCPFRCPFCASHLLSERFSRRDPEDVFQEISFLAQDLRVRDIAFYDDALLPDHENHLDIILNRIVQKKVRVRMHTPNGLHPKWIDPDSARLMFRSGFRTMRLSYESIDPDRQKEMGYKVSDSDLVSAVRYLKDAGFALRDIGSYVLMGLPGQDLKEVADSMEFILGQGIRVSLASFSPIPGTDSWYRAVAGGLIREDADPLLTNNSIFPLVPDPVQRKKLVELGTLAAVANQKVVRNESPFSDGDWKRKLRHLLS